MPIKNNRIVLPIAMVCLTVSILMEHLFSGGSRITLFVEGLLLGLSFALSVFALIRGALAHE